MRGGEGRGGEEGSWWKEGEGTSHSTYKNDTWTDNSVGMDCGSRRWAGWKREKLGHSNRTTIKK